MFVFWLLCLVFLFLAVWYQMIAAAGDFGIFACKQWLLNKIEDLQTMKCCTVRRCYSVVTFSFVIIWANVYCLWVFFCAINPVKSVRRYNSNMHLHYSAVNSWLTIPTFPQSEIKWFRQSRSDQRFGHPPVGDAQNARDMGMGMPKTQGCPYHCDTGFDRRWSPVFLVPVECPYSAAAFKAAFIGLRCSRPTYSKIWLSFNPFRQSVGAQFPTLHN